MNEFDEVTKKKGRAGFVVTIIILILLLLGALGYIAYDKGYLDQLLGKEEPVKEEIKKEKLVNGYEFKLKEIECKNENNTCVKELKVAYNGKNHDVKIRHYEKTEEEKLEESDENETVNNIYFDLYIDNKKIDQIKSGSIYLDPDTNEPQVEFDADFDGYIYIFNDKYLGFLFPTVADTGSTGYVLNLYDEGKIIDSKTSADKYNQSDNGTIIKVLGQGFGSEAEKGASNDLSSIVFDGTTLKYWWISCDDINKTDDEEGPTNVAVYLALTFDGKKVNIKSTGEKQMVTGGGAAGICFDTKTDNFSSN